MRRPARPSLSRRWFLKSAGAAASGAFLSGCEDEDPYALEKPDVPGTAGWVTGEERFVATACGQCPAACGVRVRVVEARATKIEGNTACPLNQGGIGPRGLAGTQVLYDPDRVRGPLRRVRAASERSSADTWESVSWDDAASALAERLSALREARRADRLAIVYGRERGMLLELWQRFARAYGTPNLIDGFSTGDGPIAEANLLMQGIDEIPAYDWKHVRYVLSLGSGMLESTCQMVYFARSQAEIRRGRAGTRAKVVHVGPVYSRTAMNADEFIAVRPQTYGAFALGIAHVLVRDGLHDADFVREHAFGFDAWDDEDGRRHAGFADLLAEYPPERVAELCGLHADVVERVAAQMAAARPAFAFAGAEELHSPEGLGAALAVQALNALLGAIDRPGGVLTQRAAPLEELPEVEPDDVASETGARAPLGGFRAPPTPSGRVPLHRLPEAILASEESPIELLLLHYANPLYSRARPERWRAALAKVETVVSFSPFLDETSQECADWVLPDLTYLERWEDAAPAPSVGHPVYGLRQPVVEPVCEGRATGDLLLQLAERLGDPLAAALPSKDLKDALKKRLVGIYRARRGSIVAEKGSDFLKEIYERGYWFDAEYQYERWDEVLRTPSGRFEFFSNTMLQRIRDAARTRGTSAEALLAELGVREDLDRLCMPRHGDEAWSGAVERYPYRLLPYRPSTYAEGSGANLPWLQELSVAGGRKVWTTEAEVHPETAAEIGVTTGDRARVESPVGEIDVDVRVDAGIPPGLVRIPRGGGHTAMGRFARGWGANVMRLVAGEGGHAITGFDVVIGTRVALRRIES